MATAQASDGVAYDALLRELLPMLRGMARRWLADPAEAEDAVQDTLLTFHRLRRAYDPTRPIRPWLAAICERRCLDRLQRRMRETARETSIEAFADRLGAPRAEDGAARRAAGGELRAAVAALPRVQRSAVTWAKLQDLPLAEASACSGLSVGALKVATHRAVRTLRMRFGVAAAMGA